MQALVQPLALLLVVMFGLAVMVGAAKNKAVQKFFVVTAILLAILAMLPPLQFPVIRAPGAPSLAMPKALPWYGVLLGGLTALYLLGRATEGQ